MPDSPLLLHRSRRPRLLDLFCGAGTVELSDDQADHEWLNNDAYAEEAYPPDE